MDADAQALDSWGLPIIPPTPPPVDDEIGWTTKDDSPDAWEPAGPVTRQRFMTELFWNSTFTSVGWFRFLLSRAGVLRTRRKDLL